MMILFNGRHQQFIVNRIVYIIQAFLLVVCLPINIFSLFHATPSPNFKPNNYLQIQTSNQTIQILYFNFHSNKLKDETERLQNYRRLKLHNREPAARLWQTP